MPDSFLDTNVLVYLASADTGKAERAEQLIAAGGVISVQVLNELTNVGRRKMRLSWAEMHDFLVLVRAFLSIEPITVETHETGLALAERYGLSVYDAMIVASAVLSGCTTLWSEDMQHDVVIDGVRIMNPFKAA
jgi:predicted nucleic acid-binding protein